ncbi:MAG: LD-carboxypeptidase [Clostridia bacterium]|nr:LD-carboxypeptidase [Clostridia bacterium]
MNMLAPNLKKGAVIGLCSPSSKPSPEGAQKYMRGLKRMGFEIVEAENMYKDTDGYLPSIAERAADFNQMIHDPRVDMIFFSGGECGPEILPYIDYAYLKAHPKTVVSYSDSTSILNAIWSKTGLTVYYGQSPVHFKDLRQYDWEHFEKHLMHGPVDKHFANSDWHVQYAGQGSGTLVGGYARNVAMMLDGPHFSYDPNEKYVLFLEDHEKFGGPDYVSAMISHIEQSNFIHCVTGLIFGHYSTTLNEHLLARLKRFGEKHQVPVVYCDDFGHGVNHAILPIGRKAVLDTEKCELRYE